MSKKSYLEFLNEQEQVLNLGTKFLAIKMVENKKEIPLKQKKQIKNFVIESTLYETMNFLVTGNPRHLFFPTDELKAVKRFSESKFPRLLELIEK